jgi:ABC-type uncharacterized transport system involved in gliding motility auxiliary subunit
VPVLEWHAITEKMLEQKVNLVLPRARSLAASVPAEQKELKVETLLRSSDGAWGETDLTADKARRDERDLAGPLTYAVAVSRVKAATDKNAAEPTQEQEASDKQPIALVVGNSGLARNQALGFQGNADFLVNGVNWLLGEEQMLTIRPKAEEVRLVQMEAGQAALVFYGTTFFLPLALLALGLGVWLRRRAR